MFVFHVHVCVISPFSAHFFLVHFVCLHGVMAACMYCTCMDINTVNVMLLALQYHYNSQTGQYCYYDPTQQTYVPVAGDGYVHFLCYTPGCKNNKNERKAKPSPSDISLGTKLCSTVMYVLSWTVSFPLPRPLQEAVQLIAMQSVGGLCSTLQYDLL